MLLAADFFLNGSSRLALLVQDGHFEFFLGLVE